MAKRIFQNYTAPPIDADICNAWQNHVHDGTDADGHNAKINAVDHVDWGSGASLESVPGDHEDAAAEMPTLALRGRGLFTEALRSSNLLVNTKAVFQSLALFGNILVRQEGTSSRLKLRRSTTEEHDVVLDVHAVDAGNITAGTVAGATITASNKVVARNVPIAFARVTLAQQSSYTIEDDGFGTIQDLGNKRVKCVGARHLIAIPHGGSGGGVPYVHITKHGTDEWSWNIEGTTVAGVHLQLLFF